MCFAYLDFYSLYEIFYCLNQRFKQLIQYQTNIHINLNSIPSRKFLTFCFQVNQCIKTSQNYCLSIVVNDKYRLNLILEDDLFKDTFSKLKSLSLSTVDAGTIHSLIFNKTIKLYQRLERLNLLHEISEKHEGSNDIDYLCSSLISSKMKSLKYLRLNFESYWCGCERGWDARPNYVELEFNQLIVGNRSLSNLETLIIGNIPHNHDNDTTTKISFKTFNEKLLPCLPKLKNLIINAIHFDQKQYSRQNIIYIPPSTIERNPNIPLNLKLIKIWIDDKYAPDDVKTMRKFLRNFFMNNNSSDTTTIKIFYINNKNILKRKLRDFN
ncbi:unnamed protein product [Rotaria sordida]|uniref:Uncharacterized protein n=1 Tax=Rotaria sordida TaxID=392033 RepID=A0A814KSB3_9BILA|nr:unnamed protein product [Rotaria sordida]CAF4219716.1 unnamed protein product [Rotaria sordida]